MFKRILPILLASVAPAQSATIAVHPYEMLECHQEIERKCVVGRAELIVLRHQRNTVVVVEAVVQHNV